MGKYGKQAPRGTMNQHHSALSEKLEKKFRKKKIFFWKKTTFFQILKNYSLFTLNLNQPKLDPKQDFFRQNDYTIWLQVKFWKYFFAMSQKLRFWPKMAIFWHVRQNLGKMRIFLKKGLCYLFTFIVPQLHAKFRGNPQSGFRDEFVTNGRTDGRTDGRTRLILQNRSLRWLKKKQLKRRIIDQLIALSIWSVEWGSISQKYHVSLIPPFKSFFKYFIFEVPLNCNIRNIAWFVIIEPM